MDIQDFFSKLIRMIVSLLVGVGVVSGPSGAPRPVPQAAISTRNPLPNTAKYQVWQINRSTAHVGGLQVKQLPRVGGLQVKQLPRVGG